MAKVQCELRIGVKNAACKHTCLGIRALGSLSSLSSCFSAVLTASLTFCKAASTGSSGFCELIGCKRKGISVLHLLEGIGDAYWNRSNTSLPPGAAAPLPKQATSWRFTHGL